MHTTANHIIVTTACDSADCRDDIINALLSRKLAACVQVSNITSHYVWKGITRCTEEFLLTIKTHSNLLPAVASTILEHHTYEVPEILATQVYSGHTPYLRWMDDSTEHAA